MFLSVLPIGCVPEDLLELGLVCLRATISRELGAIRRRVRGAPWGRRTPTRSRTRRELADLVAAMKQVVERV
jgi:hypothetical protein